MGERKDWHVDDDLVLVVAAGIGAREQAIRFAIYHSQNRRAFRPARWIAFYARCSIDTMAEIDGPPEDDVIIADRPELGALATDMQRLGQGERVPHTLFKLKAVRPVGPIENDAIDKSGRKTAWTRKQRYTSIERLRRARLTSHLQPKEVERK